MVRRPSLVSIIWGGGVRGGLSGGASSAGGASEGVCGASASLIDMYSGIIPPSGCG